ncbi:origin recognition complex subunit 3 N-terminus-domain-containing protein [Limtongia smithiae]|uniref:origin recognition complex subunit 3 N-terminus-domain-containing protein n=1 Tax=Limtongia smithiae TaxID=1125753 RepID=UPI0034CFF991
MPPSAAVAVDPDIDDGELVTDPDAHKLCYLIKRHAPAAEEISTPSRRTKRARVVASVTTASPKDPNNPFIPLDASLHELPEHVALRYELCKTHLATVQTKADAVLHDADKSVVADVTEYIAKVAEYDADFYTTVPVGLVLAGANISNHARLFQHLAKHVDTTHAGETVTVSVTSRDAGGIRDFLRCVVTHVMKQQRTDDDEDEDELTAPAAVAGPSAAKDGKYEEQAVLKLRTANTLAAEGVVDKRMSYDLDVLVDWYRAQTVVKRIAVIVQDADGFDAVLPEAIRMLHLYRDRLPFVLLLGVATTLPIFNTKLPKWAIRMIDFKCFDVLRTDSSLSALIDGIMLSPETPFLVGPRLFRSLLKRYNAQTRRLETFTQAIQYSIMAHFFANPLSVMLSPPPSIAISDDHITALRAIPSFHDHISRQLDLAKDGSADAAREVRALLTSRTALVSFVETQRRALFETFFENHRAAVWMLEILQNASTTYTLLTPKRGVTQMYADAISGRLLKPGGMVDELLQFTTKMNADTIDALAAAVDARFPDTHPVVQMKRRWNIEATKGKAQHLKLLAVIQNDLRELFTASLGSFEDIPFHELFVFDEVALCEAAFAPLYRPAIERALMTPETYLGTRATCEDRLEKPLISYAYALYRDSGQLVNVADFWTAFHEAVAGRGANVDGAEGDAYSAKNTVAWFYKAVNELQYLGFLRETSTKRKDASSVSILQKLVWDGL